MANRTSRSICALAAGLGPAILLGASFLSPASAAPEPPSLSKRGPDPAPSAPLLALEEVFVTSAPRKINEAQTIKEAYAKVKNGGVIFITQGNTDISNDGSALVITRPVTIALDPDLKTQMAIKSDDDLARARVNAAADGLCFIMGQDERGDESGRRTPRDEVTVRDVEFVPNPGAAGNCIEIFSGRLFLDNVKIAGAGSIFGKGVIIQGGEVITNKKFRVTASKVGIDVRAGALEIADGAVIDGAGGASAQSPQATASCKDAPANFSVGVYVGASADARVGDPAAVLKSASISGFDYGVCAAGGGATIVGSSVENTAIGVQADKSIRLSKSDISKSRIAGFVAGSGDAEAIDNEIFNNGSGAVIPDPPLATFKGNLFAFNGTAIAYGKNFRKAQPLLLSFTGNKVLCNEDPGSLAAHRRFKKANERKYNAPEFCTGARKADRCVNLHRSLGLSDSDCAGR